MTDKYENIEIAIRKNTLENIKKTADALHIGINEAVHYLLLMLEALCDGTGEAEFVLLLDEYNADYIRAEKERNGIDFSATVNAALERERKTGEEEFFAFEYYKSGQGVLDEAIRVSDHIAKSIRTKETAPEEEVMLQTCISRRAIRYLARLIKNGSSADRVLSKAFWQIGYMICKETHEEEERFSIKISSENMEYIRREIRFGESLERLVSNDLLLAHMACVNERKEKGLPLTEKEEFMDSINWN